jgi:molecular chaperone DnaK
VDVIPLSLGIETMGGVATKLIEKNTHIPTKKEQVFSTAADNQTSTEIHIVQGERAQASDNKSLGRFVLDGIPPAPRGMPQIEVVFDVDSNGVLNVKAIDKSTGKEQSIRIEASSGLSKEDIERMKKEAEDHADEDAKKKELIETRNLADQMIYTAEKSLREHGNKVDEATKTAINQKIAGVKEAKDKEDKAAIEKVTQELSTEMQKIGEIIQKAAQAEVTKKPEGTEPEPEAEVRDADVAEDKKDEADETK